MVVEVVVELTMLEFQNTQETKYARSGILKKKKNTLHQTGQAARLNTLTNCLVFLDFRLNGHELYWFLLFFFFLGKTGHSMKNGIPREHYERTQFEQVQQRF